MSFFHGAHTKIKGDMNNIYANNYHHHHDGRFGNAVKGEYVGWQECGLGTKPTFLQSFESTSLLGQCTTLPNVVMRPNVIQRPELQCKTSWLIGSKMGIRRKSQRNYLGNRTCRGR
jgi:hypothetical protein